MDHLISPYKGDLVNLLLDEADAENIRIESESYPAPVSWTRRYGCKIS